MVHILVKFRKRQKKEDITECKEPWRRKLMDQLFDTEQENIDEIALQAGELVTLPVGETMSVTEPLNTQKIINSEDIGKMELMADRIFETIQTNKEMRNLIVHKSDSTAGKFQDHRF